MYLFVIIRNCEVYNLLTKHFHSKWSKYNNDKNDKFYWREAFLSNKERVKFRSQS